MRRIKKFIIIPLVIVSLVIGLNVYRGNLSKASTIENRNLVDNDEINEIVFPQLGGELPTDAVFSLDKEINFLGKKTSVASEKNILLNSSDEIKKAYKYTSETNIKEKHEKYKSIFKFDSTQKSAKDTLSKSTILEDNNKILTLNDDGTFDYHLKNTNVTKENKVLDEDAIKIAKKYMNDNDLNMNGFEYSNVGYETVTSSANSNDSKIVRKFVYFNRFIDNKITYGMSRIVVGINQDAEVSDVYYVAKNVDTIQNVKIKDFKSAYDDLKSLNGMITMDSDTKKVNIKNVELVYWEDNTPNSKQNYMQPVYLFTGETLNAAGNKGEFSGIVQAIPGEMTKHIEESYEAPISTPKLPKSTKQ